MANRRGGCQPHAAAAQAFAPGLCAPCAPGAMIAGSKKGNSMVMRFAAGAASVLLVGMGTVSAQPGEAAPLAPEATPLAPAEAPAQAIAADAAASFDVSTATLYDVFREVRAFVDEAQEVPADAPRLGLAEVVQRSIENSGRIKAAEEVVVQREAQRDQAKSARKPTLGAQVQYVYLGGLEQDLPTSRLADLFIDTGSLGLGDHLGIGSVSAQQVIYAGGRIKAAIRAGEDATAAEAHRRDATLTDIAMEATRSYYQALLATALVRVANESANTFQRHLADANKALEVGAVSRFEVIRAQTELKTREADLARALTGNDVATLNLRRLMALDGDGPLYLEPDWFTAALPSEDVESLVAEAMEKRPELNALDKGIEAAREQVKVREAGKKPTIGALAQYQHIEGGSEIIPQGFMASGVMRWDFYTGGRTKAEILEAEAQVRELQHQRHDLEQAVKLDVRAAFLRANEAAQRILLQFGTVQLAQQGQELAELRFQQGAGTQTETLDADLALVTARTGLVQALGDYFIAQADLAKASGRGWQPDTVGPPPGEEAKEINP